MEVFMNNVTTRGNTTRRKNAGSCGSTPKKDGSGGGIGNRKTRKQPKKK